MDVRVDHPGDQRAPAGVDRAGQRIEAACPAGRPRVHDPAVLRHEDRIVDRIKAAPVEQARPSNDKGVSHRASIFPAMVAVSKRTARHE
jgi:hypothetical protein